MALILIVITDQIRYIRINEREIYKGVDKGYDNRLAIKGK